MQLAQIKINALTQDFIIMRHNLMVASQVKIATWWRRYLKVKKAKAILD